MWLKRNAITPASFTAIAALKWAKLEFYDQEKHEYSEELLDSPQEIASCVSSISLTDGAPFVHAHAVLGGQNGIARGGHLLAERVFAAEIQLVELMGERIERKSDSVTS